MKPLAECEYTAFISYAHADDAAWFDWVTQFRNELARSLRAMLRGVRVPDFHLSGENGPVAGALSDELKRRVEASFAMIIVVHDNYAASDWCLKELEYFKTLFGDEGCRQRLYIVAMSETAMQRVAHSPAWQQLMPGADQLWIPFFDPAEPERPLDIYLGPGLVAPAFRTPFERLRSDFAAKLKLAATGVPPRGNAPADVASNGVAVGAASGPGISTASATSAATSVPTPDALGAGAPAAAAGTLTTSAGVATAPGAPPVLVGFVPSASSEAARAAVAALAAQGVPVRAVDQTELFAGFPDFATAQALVLPFDDTPPLLTTMAGGGHLEVQREAWLQAGRSADRILWLDLRAAPLPPAAWRGGAAYVAQQGVPTLSLAALVQQLAPAAPPPPPASPAHAVRIYIESNRNERTLWEPLGDQIRRRWDALSQRFAPVRVPPLSLRPRGLPVDQIDSFPSLDDADGVVLLWGRKTSDALVAQINKVENKMAPGRDAAPGIVAYLMPPQQSSEPLPAWGWQVLRFNAADEQAIDVVDEEDDELERFLRKVFERRLQRDREGGDAAPGGGGA